MTKFKRNKNFTKKIRKKEEEIKRKRIEVEI
jgi:hypothetical protein